MVWKIDGIVTCDYLLIAFCLNLSAMCGMFIVIFSQDSKMDQTMNGLSPKSLLNTFSILFLYYSAGIFHLTHICEGNLHYSIIV